MSSLVYILRKSFINTIKELFRKPAALITYIIIAAFFIFSFVVSSGSEGVGEQLALDMNVIKAIFCGYIAFIFIIGISSSLSGSSFFRMADVNLLFTAPLNAGNILMYGFIKQLATNILVMIFLAFQYPNWKRMFGLTDGSGWILIIAYLLMIAVSSLLGMILYSRVSRKPGNKQKIKMLIYLGVVLFLMPIIIQIFNTKDILQSTVGWLSSDYIKYVPFIGWFTEILLGAVTGINIDFIISISLILAVLMISFIYLFRMDTDFYEDVLAGTELKESVLASAREGKTTGTNVYKKYKKVNFKFTMEGSKAIYQKQMLEKKKTGIWLVSLRTLAFLGAGIIASYAIPLENNIILTMLLGICAYMMMILSMVGTWEGELTKHYIYLIPAAPFNKMIAATLPEVLKLLVEGILVFGITGVVLKVNPIIILSVIGVYVTLGSTFIYFDVFLRRIYGRIHGNFLRVFLRIFLMFIIIAIVVIPTAIIIGVTESFVLGFFVAIVINVCLTLLFMLLGVGLFANPEL